LPDFYWYKIPKREKYTKFMRTIPNVHKIHILKDRQMYQVSIKYTDIFQCKTLQNLPKFGYLFWKLTIWQPWCCCCNEHKLCRWKEKHRMKSVAKKFS
jgi:hypothetical protein